MNINSIATLATGMAQANTSDAASMLVFKKSLDAQTSAAMGLINAIPKPPSLPPHLGNIINTVA
ncbi:MAG TPA: YjfB family protein [Methylophilaceae bacterium]|nr:YjfB family protein [Methylophilaceae bacterium]